MIRFRHEETAPLPRACRHAFAECVARACDGSSGAVAAGGSQLEKLEAETVQLREENAALRLENTRLKLENQLLRDEIARLKNPPPRPPFRPPALKGNGCKTQRHLGAEEKAPWPEAGCEAVEPAGSPACRCSVGSRFKGYRSVYVRDLVMKAELVHYRRECWLTPDGKTILASLPAGINAGYGLNLRRLCLMLHSQGQVTTGGLATLLNDIGLDISKRQVVRLVTGQLDGFAAEDAAVLHAGLVSSSYVTVDDTGARHSHNPNYTTQRSAAEKAPALLCLLSKMADDAFYENEQPQIMCGDHRPMRGSCFPVQYDDVIASQPGYLAHL